MSTETLYEVGKRYIRESQSARKLRDQERLHAFGISLWRIYANRRGVDPDRHVVQGVAYADITLRWLSSHGLRASTVGHGITDFGFLIQGDDEPPLLLHEGDTLRWDGQRIVRQQ